LNRVGPDELAALLLHLTERQELFALERGACFLGELAPGRLLGTLVFCVLAFGDGPRAQILLCPEWPAWMDEQDLKAAFGSALKKDSGALSRGGCHK